MERYQEAFYRDRMRPGERSGGERWSVIAPHLPTEGTLLDVGSNLGYFSTRAALERPKLGVVSLEIDPHLASEQSRVVESHSLANVVVLQGGLNAAVAEEWAATCDHFDAVLLLSIIHWFDDPERVVGALSRMAGRLICEVPDPRDEGACGQAALRRWPDPVKWFESVTSRDVRVVGRMRRHTSDHESWVISVDGSFTRHPQYPYLQSTFEHPEGRHYEIEHTADGSRISVRGVSTPYQPGVNLHNLMSLGALRYPRAAVLEVLARDALDRHPGHPDPLAHNMIWSAEGFTLIDDEPIDALTTSGDARRALKHNLSRWEAGETVLGGVQVRRYSLMQRIRYSRVGHRVIAWLPSSAKERLRRVARRLLR